MLNVGYIYDTVEEIEYYLFVGGTTTKLKDIHDLNNIRRHIYRNGNNKLNEFVILGRYCIDSFGQLSDIFVDDKNYDPNIAPKVISLNDFYLYVRQVHPQDDYPTSVSRRLGKAFPMDSHICPYRKNHWTPEDGNSAISIEEFVQIEGKDFIGKSLNSFGKFLDTEGRFYSYFRHSHIRNDKNNNFEEKYPTPWVHIEDLNYIIKEGDDIGTENTYFYHKKCLINERYDKNHHEFRRALFVAGFEIESSIKILSYYDNENFWTRFNVLTDEVVDEITIGWRKRVIEIRYDKKYGNLFPELRETNDVGYFYVYHDKLQTSLNELYQRMKVYNER